MAGNSFLALISICGLGLLGSFAILFIIAIIIKANIWYWRLYKDIGDLTLPQINAKLKEPQNISKAFLFKYLGLISAFCCFVLFLAVLLTSFFPSAISNQIIPFLQLLGLVWIASGSVSGYLFINMMRQKG
jgi:hypothetical protein